MTSCNFARRSVFIYSGLLVLSFGATCGYLMMQGALPVPAFLARDAASQAVLSAERSNASLANTGMAGELPGTAFSGPEPSATGASIDFVEEERKQAASAATQAGHLAISAASVKERSEAMIQLNIMSTRLQRGDEPELLHALESAATVAPDSQLRMSAVVALANAARRMPDNSQVLMILERASNDPNMAVSRRAKTALKSLRGS
jgi:hypothetical protein